MLLHLNDKRIRPSQLVSLGFDQLPVNHFIHLQYIYKVGIAYLRIQYMEYFGLSSSGHQVAETRSSTLARSGQQVLPSLVDYLNSRSRPTLLTWLLGLDYFNFT